MITFSQYLQESTQRIGNIDYYFPRTRAEVIAAIAKYLNVRMILYDKQLIMWNAYATDHQHTLKVMGIPKDNCETYTYYRVGNELHCDGETYDNIRTSRIWRFLPRIKIKVIEQYADMEKIIDNGA